MASKNYIGLARLTEVFTLLKNKLHKVAFSGSYNDLDDKPFIQNALGTDLARRAKTQFVDSHVTDDSTNNKTLIENIKEVTSAQFENVTEDGFYDVTDELDEDLTAEDIPYGNSNVKAALDTITNPTVITTITQLTPAVPNGGATTKIAEFTLPAGKWLIWLRGYTPINGTGNDITEQPTVIGVANIGYVSLTYRFNFFGFKEISEETIFDVNVTNWESAATPEAGTIYNLTAIKIG